MELPFTHPPHGSLRSYLSERLQTALSQNRAEQSQPDTVSPLSRPLPRPCAPTHPLTHSPSARSRHSPTDRLPTRILAFSVARPPALTYPLPTRKPTLSSLVPPHLSSALPSPPRPIQYSQHHGHPTYLVHRESRESVSKVSKGALIDKRRAALYVRAYVATTAKERADGITEQSREGKVAFLRIRGGCALRFATVEMLGCTASQCFVDRVPRQISPGR